ncbi:hypothetical protein ACFLT2_00105 [Acidobacteriota bacterium]
MKTCPHCDSSFPENMERCPQCGAVYWDSDSDGRYETKGLHEEEEQGCLSILIFHLLVALGLAVFFVLFGFVVNLLVHFEANQVKIAWIAASLLLGGTLSLIIRKLKRKKSGKTLRDEIDYSD